MAEPMYQQIAEDLRRQIEAGELPPGSQLATEMELRDVYHASRNTVRDAIRWLVTQGLAETRPGQGTFVVEKIIPFVTTLSGDQGGGLGGGEGQLYLAEVDAARRAATASVPRVEIQPATGVIAAELRAAAGAQVVSRHQQRFIDGTPWSLQTSFYPMWLVERGAMLLIQATDIQMGTVTYLRETLGLEQAGYRDIIAVRVPDATETAFFRLPGDGRVPVLESRRTAFDPDGTPTRLTITSYPADRTLIAVNHGQVPDGPD